jgi:hypothetical protein
MMSQMADGVLGLDADTDPLPIGHQELPGPLTCARRHPLKCPLEWAASLARGRRVVGARGGRPLRRCVPRDLPYQHRPITVRRTALAIGS